MAEQGQHLKGQIWQRMVQAVRTFLRSLGFSVLFSQRDILEMLRKAEAHVGMKAPETRSPEFKKWFGDWESSAILNGKSIATLKSSDAPSGGFKAVEDWAARIFADQGGKAIRAGLGEVLLDHRAAQTSMAHGGANKFKKVAFAAVKDVIERGALVKSATRGDVDSFYFSAPVDIDGVTNIETVLVHRDANTKRMYLHSVMAKESLLSHQVSRADAGASERSGSTDSEGITSIVQEYKRCLVVIH